MKEKEFFLELLCKEIFRIVKKENVPFPYNLESVEYMYDATQKDGIMILFNVEEVKEYALEMGFYYETLRKNYEEMDIKTVAYGVLGAFYKNYQEGAFDGKIIILDPFGASLEGDVGRNEKCPCGSGRKYKKCCLLKEGKIKGKLPEGEMEGNHIKTMTPCRKHTIYYPNSLVFEAVLKGKYSLLYKKCECGKGYLFLLEDDGIHFRMIGEELEIKEKYEEIKWEEKTYINEEMNICKYKVAPSKKDILKMFK